jgi:hypothetical protein
MPLFNHYFTVCYVRSSDKHWLLTAESQVQSRVTSYMIYGGRNGIGAGFSAGFFGVSPFIILPLWLHPYLSPPPVGYSS